jgi:hypothetical protein
MSLVNHNNRFLSKTRVVSGNPNAVTLSRKQSIVADPWGGYVLSPNASATDIEAYTALRTEITEKNALSSVKELATQRWWLSHSAQTFDAHKDSNMIALLRQALQHHKKRLEDEKKLMEAPAINFQIDRLLEPLTEWNGKNLVPRRNLNPAERVRYDALIRIKADHSLVTPQMLEDAKNLYSAHQTAEMLKKKTEKEMRERAEKEHQVALSTEITRMQASGWM